MIMTIKSAALTGKWSFKRSLIEEVDMKVSKEDISHAMETMYSELKNFQSTLNMQLVSKTEIESILSRLHKEGGILSREYDRKIKEKVKIEPIDDKMKASVLQLISDIVHSPS